eukprot:g26377.t1
MDQVAQLAQVAQEQLLSAWAMLGPVSSKASEAFVLAGKQMEPLQSTVMAAQVQLHDYVLRLSSVLAVGMVQDLAHASLGQRKLAPELLLWIFLSLVALALLVLLVVPKAKLAVWGFFYFFLARHWAGINLRAVVWLRIVFIRHGESQWNSVFNKGWKIFLPFRLVRALIKEAFMLFQRDSLFYDSPLNDQGLLERLEPPGCREPGTCHKPVEQLQVEDIVSIIMGDAGDSLLAAWLMEGQSSTFAKDRVHLMTALQDRCRNVDTLSITRARTVPKVPVDEAKMKNMGDLMTLGRDDHRQNAGNKTLGMKADKRQKQFVKWVLEQKDIDCIIVAGHSLWFREFFKSFMPKSSTHAAKTTKMVNCGVVAFDLYRTVQHSTEVIRALVEDAGNEQVFGGCWSPES